MDTDRFDHLTRIVATRRRGIAALIAMAGLAITTPADAKRGNRRCKHVSCRGECCKKGETCEVFGCFGSHELGACFSQYACSTDSECDAVNPLWYCSRGRCCNYDIPT